MAQEEKTQDAPTLNFRQRPLSKGEASKEGPWTRKRVAAEQEAEENIDKDPVGPVKAHAQTLAESQARRAPGGEVFGDRAPQRKNNPDNPFVKGSK